MSWVKISVIALLVISVLLVSLTFEVWAAAFLGVLFALSLNGPAVWIRSKWAMPAWAATVLTLLMVLTVLTGLGFVLGPPIVKQAGELKRELPAAMEKSLDWLEERKWGRNVVQQVESLSGMTTEQLNSDDEANDGPTVAGQTDQTDAAQQQTLAVAGQTDAAQEHAADNDSESDNGNEEDDDKASANDEGTDETRSIILPILQTLVSMLSVTAWTVVLLLVSFVITLYVALNPEVYRRGILWLIPAEHEAKATQTMTHMCSALRWWMLGRLASMLAIGLLTSLGMWLIGMPAPLALGTLAGLLSFVPNIGPIVAAVPGLLLAFPEGAGMFLLAMGVYVVAQIIESNLISPLIDQYTVTIPPAVLIFVQVVMGVLTGAWGVLIATPLLVVVMVLTQQLYVRGYIRRPIKVIGSSEEEAPDESTERPRTKRTPLSPLTPATP